MELESISKADLLAASVAKRNVMLIGAERDNSVTRMQIFVKNL